MYDYVSETILTMADTNMYSNDASGWFSGDAYGGGASSAGYGAPYAQNTQSGYGGAGYGWLGCEFGHLTSN